MFSGLDDSGLILRNLLDLSPPSVCGIFRNDPSGTLEHCGKEEGGGGEGSWIPTLWMLSSLKSVFFLLAVKSPRLFLPVLLELSSLTINQE